jgi:hypothetical protein
MDPGNGSFWRKLKLKSRRISTQGLEKSYGNQSHKNHDFEIPVSFPEAAQSAERMKKQEKANFHDADFLNLFYLAIQHLA